MTRANRHIAAAALLGLGVTLALPALPLVAPSQLALAQVAPRGAPASFADLADKVKPSVVSIQVSGTPRAGQNAPAQRGQPPRGGPRLPESIPEEYRKFFEDFLGKGLPGGPGAPGGQGQLPPTSMGSGFVISEDGYVVTNNHVVENGSKYVITFDNKKKYEAEFIGSDSRTDVALLKIKGNDRFPAVPFAKTDTRVGEWVIAVGNPFGFGGTVTAGIVSAMSRDLDGSTALNDFIQIDAAVNRGNSGGPTFNMNGEVIGVNTAIYSPSGGNVGIAFAIPARTVVEIVNQLRSGGTVSRGWLGVQIQNVDEDAAAALGLPDARGAIIGAVTPGGPAQASGLKDGDTILMIDNAKIADSRDLARKIAGYAPNSSIAVGILRNGKPEVVNVKLGDFKDASGAQTVPTKAEPSKAPSNSLEMSSLGLKLAAPGSAQSKTVRDGVLITEVSGASDAAQKGLKAGDIILDVFGQVTNSAADVTKALEDAEKQGRAVVMLRVKSGEAARYVPIKIKKG
jgi:serine protease Do